MLDMVVDRRVMKDTIGRILRYTIAAERPVEAPQLGAAAVSSGD